MTHQEQERNVTTQSQAPDAGAIKELQRRAWAAGEYARVGNRLVIMGELLCEALDLRAGERVLDVATGSGNAAISAARRSCEVRGLDYVPEWAEYARERAEAERLSVTFEVGDAENLPYPNASFDAVLSTIGVMFAPDQEKAAGELLRVCRPGGKVGLANWTPDGFVGDFFGTIDEHVPPPPGLESPLSWGTEERLQELLGAGVSSLTVTRRSYVLRYSSAQHFIEHYRSYFGPMREAFEALDKPGQDALARDIEELLDRWNASGDKTLVVPADYLEVVAIRR
jgi:ubiquinone/menaquinone biosynthesis C-methylase UbiE